MGGVNPTIQLAAALDRRGISVSVDLDRVRVHIQGREKMIIERRTSGIPVCRYGREWSWDYGGRSGTHPVSDHEGAADAIEAMLRGLPGLAGTPLRYRMDHMGQTFEQEDQESLEAARAKNAARRDSRPDQGARVSADGQTSGTGNQGTRE